MPVAAGHYNAGAGAANLPLKDRAPHLHLRRSSCLLIWARVSLEVKVPGLASSQRKNTVNAKAIACAGQGADWITTPIMSSTNFDSSNLNSPRTESRAP